MIVAVTGATGYLGRFIVDELLQHGDHVRAWTRTASDRTGFNGAIEWLEGDLAQADSIAALVSGADAVVHAAFDHIPGRFRGGEGQSLAAFLERNLMGSLRLIELASQHDVSRFVVLSSRAVYGRCLPDQALDENHPVFPATHYGACKAALEHFVSSWGASRHWAINALRITGVYGIRHPFEKTKWLDLVRATLAGQAWPHAHGGTEVHGMDVAAAVRILLTAPLLAGQVLNCSDLYTSHRDLALLVQKFTGKRGPLPPAAPEGFAVMECPALASLGLRFGGQSLLEHTIMTMIEKIGQERHA